MKFFCFALKIKFKLIISFCDNFWVAAWLDFHSMTSKIERFHSSDDQTDPNQSPPSRHFFPHSFHPSPELYVGKTYFFESLITIVSYLGGFACSGESPNNLRPYKTRFLNRFFFTVGWVGCVVGRSPFRLVSVFFSIWLVDACLLIFFFNYFSSVLLCLLFGWSFQFPPTNPLLHVSACRRFVACRDMYMQCVETLGAFFCAKQSTIQVPPQIFQKKATRFSVKNIYYPYEIVFPNHISPKNVFSKAFAIKYIS